MLTQTALKTRAASATARTLPPHPPSDPDVNNSLIRFLGDWERHAPNASVCCLASMDLDMVANYYKPGPSTTPGKMTHRIANPSSRDKADGFGKWYVANNVVQGNKAVTDNNWAGGVQPQHGDSYIEGFKLDKPFESMPINQQTAEDAYASVLDNAGATLPKRNIVDARIIDETRGGYATYEGKTYEQNKKVSDPSKKCGMIDSQADVGGWPELKSTTAPTDTDHDGMPDDWEITKGLDPKNAADRNNVASDGYTMLEKYLNSIGEQN